MKKKLILFAPLILLGTALFVALGGEIVRLLWNWLLPSLFGWPRITFWQALGLLALCRILFGGLGGGFRPSPGRRMAGRWGHMSPEERERFRERIRERGGFGPSPSESKGQ
jgi:hypothetical protein